MRSPGDTVYFRMMGNWEPSTYVCLSDTAGSAWVMHNGTRHLVNLEHMFAINDEVVLKDSKDSRRGCILNIDRKLAGVSWDGSRYGEDPTARIKWEGIIPVDFLKLAEPASKISFAFRME